MNGIGENLSEMARGIVAPNTWHMWLSAGTGANHPIESMAMELALYERHMLGLGDVARYVREGAPRWD